MKIGAPRDKANNKTNTTTHAIIPLSLINSTVNNKYRAIKESARKKRLSNDL